jgi:hypothetical protein
VWFTIALLAWQAQEQPPLVLKTETRAVQINVSVKDKKGDPIRDLQSSDFMVFDNGKPRRIQIFSGVVNSGSPSRRDPTVPPAA